MTNYLPYSEATENAIIGTMFSNPLSIYSMELKFEADYFYISKNIYISKAILELHNVGNPTDIMLVHAILRDRNELSHVGDLYGLQTFLSYSALPEILDSMIQDLHSLLIKRKVIIACSEIMSRSKSIQHGHDYANFAMEKISSVSNQSIKNETFTCEEVFKKTYEKFQKNIQNPGKITGIPSGLRKLDDILGGFHASDLVVIGARPAMGKTAFALTVATSAALIHQKLTLIFSLEMSNEQLMERMIASKCKIDSSKFRTGQVDNLDLNKLNENKHYFKNTLLHFNDKSSMNIHDISAICRKIKMERKELDMIIIDYLQLMSGMTDKNNNANRERQISEITRSLKILAKDLNCPVIILSQLNRNLENRPGNRPKLSDLRESGAIEQDSDVVLLLHREEVYNKDPEHAGIAEIIVAKNRRGETDTVNTRFEGQYLLFSNLMGGL